MGFAFGAYVARKVAPPGHWDSTWTSWDDVPKHVKDEFRDGLKDMRDSMNAMLDDFEEMVR